MPDSAQNLRPVLGMILAFKPSASANLADIPARVALIWPPNRAGDYPVTLEYAEPVEVEQELVRYVDAFTSELYRPEAHAYSRPAQQASGEPYQDPFSLPYAPANGCGSL